MEFTTVLIMTQSYDQTMSVILLNERKLYKHHQKCSILDKELTANKLTIDVSNNTVAEVR